MRQNLRFTLLPEGTSDRALMPILEWVLSQHFPISQWTIAGRLVQRDRLPAGAVKSLSDRIRTAIDVYPCDILFIHRDEDGETIPHREAEIDGAVRNAGVPDAVAPIAVIPVRMTEAWLLIDERAIRTAAGFSAGRAPLNLPTLAEIERRADPKQLLHNAIRVASGRTGRKLATLNTSTARAIIADLIEDLSRLRALKSFEHFETKVCEAARDIQRQHESAQVPRSTR